MFLCTFFRSRLQVSSLFMFSVSSFCALVFLSLSCFVCFISSASFLAFLLATSPFISPVLASSVLLRCPAFPVLLPLFCLLRFPFLVAPLCFLQLFLRCGSASLVWLVVSFCFPALFVSYVWFAMFFPALFRSAVFVSSFFVLQSPPSFCLAFSHCTPHRFICSFCFGSRLRLEVLFA